MIELIIKAFLERILPCPVYMRFPDHPGNRFVVLKVEHNPRENHIDSATLVAESYGESQLEAAKLNELTKSAMDELTELPEIAGSHRGGDYPFFDTTHKRYRYQAVQNITHY